MAKTSSNRRKCSQRQEVPPQPETTASAETQKEPEQSASPPRPRRQNRRRTQANAATATAPPPEDIAAFVHSLKQSQQERLENIIPPVSSPEPTPSSPEPTKAELVTNGTAHRSSRTKRRRRPKRASAQPETASPAAPEAIERPRADEQSPATEQPPAHTQQQRPAKQKEPHQPPKHKTTPPQQSAEQTVSTPAHSKPKRPRRTFVIRDLVRMPEIPDECIPLIERVEAMLRDELSVEAGATIVLATSGGVDSVTLLDVLTILSYEHGYALHLAHVNHQLRGDESERDEAFVRSLAKRYDIPCHVTRVDTRRYARSHRLSIEEAARETRYRFLRQLSASVHAQYCAVAHTADDTAETLLLNLFRGSGLTGLAAIPPKRPLTKRAYLIRPLLGLTREEILRYATARALEWVEDSTNTDTSYLRNRVRHQVIPTLKEHFNPRIIETLSRTAQLLRGADGFIESLIESTFLQIAHISDSRVELDRAQLALLQPFMQGEIVERALRELTSTQPISHSAVERVLSLLSAENGTRQNVVGDIVALADRERIVLSQPSAVQTIYLPIFKLGSYSIGRYTITLEEVSRNEVRLGADPNVEYFDYDRLPYRLFFRTWQAGDRFAPIGMEGHHVLVADYLTNAKASDHDRRTAVVLATADDVVWLCGYRISEHYKLTNETRRIIRATFHRN